MNLFATATRGIRWLAPGLIGSCLFLLTACSAKPNESGTAQLELEIQQLRTTNQELQRFRTENQELSRLRRDNEEMRRLREQTKDLARLREENDRLRGELQALKAPKPKP
jgi:hypothetical protein